MAKSAPFLVAVLAITLAVHGRPAHAEEAGSAHYVPGQTASFLDALPGKPGPAVLNLFTAYDADTARSLPIAGLLTAGVDATIYANTIGFVYQTDKGLLGGKYAAAFALPLLDMKVRAGLAAPAGALNRTDNVTGLGDILLYPFLLGWKTAGGDLKYDVRLGIYAPTGSYHQGELANLGRNYWTFEPSASVSWLSSRLGIEASAFTGFDINTRNEATDYESGSSWHLDATLAQHLPFLGGFAGVGAAGFAYVQITGDSGAGATLGDFRGHTLGIGPVVSYVRETSRVTIAGEFKWTPELETEKRLQGDYFWAKLALMF